MFREIVAFLALTIGIVGRFKYVWQGNIIRLNKSSADISGKFMVLSWVTYLIMLIHNSYMGDIVDIVFWFVGLFTSYYAMYMTWKYSVPKQSYFRWLIGVWRKP